MEQKWAAWGQEEPHSQSKAGGQETDPGIPHPYHPRHNRAHTPSLDSKRANSRSPSSPLLKDPWLLIPQGLGPTVQTDNQGPLMSPASSPPLLTPIWNSSHPGYLTFPAFAHSVPCALLSLSVQLGPDPSRRALWRLTPLQAPKITVPSPFLLQKSTCALECNCG